MLCITKQLNHSTSDSQNIDRTTLSREVNMSEGLRMYTAIGVVATLVSNALASSPTRAIQSITDSASPTGSSSVPSSSSSGNSTGDLHQSLEVYIDGQIYPPIIYLPYTLTAPLYGPYYRSLYRLMKYIGILASTYRVPNAR